MESSVQNALQHVQTCGKVMVGCNNEGCNVPVKRREKGEHSTVCPREIINCSICNKLMERGQLDWHCERECMGRQVGCSLNCNKLNISSWLNPVFSCSVLSARALCLVFRA